MRIPRAVWALTSEGIKTDEIDQDEAKRIVKNLSGVKKDKPPGADAIDESDEISELTWEEELIDVLKQMEPDAFERLSQRLLRELGFTNVEVTGKSGDGGIDGVGVLKIGEVLSFHVVFQSTETWRPKISSENRSVRISSLPRPMTYP